MAQLLVTIIEGRNLASKDFFTDNDTFVEIYFHDENDKRRTPIVWNSKNPQWNETIVFNHSPGQDILCIDVYDKDLFRRDKIGSLQLDLQDLYDKKHIDHWYNLLRKSDVSSQGEIHIKLDYQPLYI